LDEGVKRSIAEIRRLVLDLNRTADALEQKLDLIVESLHVRDVTAPGDYDGYSRERYYYD